jgi:hypothetical protein
MGAATRKRMISTGKNMSFVRDLRVAAHSLIRTPGLAIAVVLTLSLGIGANAAIFTLVRGRCPPRLAQTHEKRTSTTWTASILVQSRHGIYAGGAARGDVGG